MRDAARRGASVVRARLLAAALAGATAAFAGPTAPSGSAASSRVPDSRTAAASRPAPSTTGESEDAAARTPEDRERLRLLHRDIETLRKGIESLTGAEEGVLGDLKAIETDSMRKQADLAEVDARLDRIVREETALASRHADLMKRLSELRAGLARRLNALYRLGRPRYARVVLSSSDPGAFLSAYRTADALSSRDARLMSEYRAQSDRAAQEGVRLARLRPVLAREQETRRLAAETSRLALERKRSMLRAVHTDRRTHQRALAELEAAGRSAERILGSLSAVSLPTPAFDRFRGLLDWPSRGPVSSPFGRTIDRKSGTTLAHNGLDIDADFGEPIRSVHDGEVVFAQWLRGYGLMVIVDHGGGWLSIYAHASVILAEKGGRVGRGEKIALVGDTGSLRGPYLYFELRKNGRPIDPAGWLRPR